MNTRHLVVVSTQRSGSNWLEDRLASHPEGEFMVREPFRRSLQSPGSFEHFRRTGFRRIYRGPLAPLGRASYLRRARTANEARILGVRVMYDQLRRAPTLGPTLLATRPMTIHLVRKNVLATHVSAARARSTGRFVTSQEPAAGSDVWVDPDSLMAALDRRVATIERHRRILNRLRVPVLDLCYEDYVAAPTTRDVTVLRFLGVDVTVALESGLRRMSSGTVADRISNSDEVASLLAGSPYEPLLYES